jgi:hypothetical protein
VAGTDLSLPNGLSYSFEVYNRNKKSLGIDLSKESGQQIIYDLAKVSDVFVQNYVVGAAERFKVDYKSLARAYRKMLKRLPQEGYEQLKVTLATRFTGVREARTSTVTLRRARGAGERRPR